MALPYYPAGVPHHWGLEIPIVDITVHSAEATYVVLGVPKGNLGWEFLFFCIFSGDPEA